MKTKIKRFILYTISFFSRLILRKKNIIINNAEFKTYKSSYKHTFVGYYDKSPFNSNSDKLLALATNHDSTISKPIEATIGYFDLSNNIFKELDKTCTWNWQQGCRMLWVDKDNIIFNTLNKNKYASKLLNISSKEEKYFNFPIYDVSTKNNLALTLDFSRLHTFRKGYGYVNVGDKTIEEKIPKDNGIWLCNLNDNSKNIIIKIKDLILIEPHEDMYDSWHYINHISINNSGNRFMFFHIWERKGKRKIRVFTADIDGKNIYLLTNESHVSHYTWKNDTELLMYATHNDVMTYYTYIDMTQERYPVCSKILKVDGHPTYINDRFFLTDSYPNKQNYQELYLFDLERNKAMNLAKFYNPFRFLAEFRCDLHPRLNKEKNKICIDINSTGDREIIIMDVNGL